MLFADMKGSTELLADSIRRRRAAARPVLEDMMEAVHRYEGRSTRSWATAHGALRRALAPRTCRRACYAACECRSPSGGLPRRSFARRRACADPDRPELGRGLVRPSAAISEWTTAWADDHWQGGWSSWRLGSHRRRRPWTRRGICSPRAGTCAGEGAGDTGRRARAARRRARALAAARGAARGFTASLAERLNRPAQCVPPWRALARPGRDDRRRGRGREVASVLGVYHRIAFRVGSCWRALGVVREGRVVPAVASSSAATRSRGSDHASAPGKGHRQTLALDERLRDVIPRFSRSSTLAEDDPSGCSVSASSAAGFSPRSNPVLRESDGSRSVRGRGPPLGRRWNPGLEGPRWKASG